LAVQFRAVDVLRWQTCVVDAGDCDDAESVLAAVENSIGELLAGAEGRPLAVRVEVRGASGAHRDLTRDADYWDRRIRERSVDRFDDQVWVEKVKFDTRPPHTSRALEVSSPACDELLSGIQGMTSLRAALADVRDELEKMLAQLRSDPRLPAPEIDWEEAETVDGLLNDVKELLVGRLVK
jgi:hypothetical protein